MRAIEVFALASMVWMAGYIVGWWRGKTHGRRSAILDTPLRGKLKVGGEVFDYTRSGSTFTCKRAPKEGKRR